MIKEAIVGAVIRQVLKAMPPETFKEIVDTFLDKVEDKVKASPGKMDDAVLLPTITHLRILLHIEDKKYGTDKEVKNGDAQA
jgi:hypothetical protein